MKKLDPKAVWLFFLSGLVSWTFLFVFFSFWSFSFITATVRLSGNGAWALVLFFVLFVVASVVVVSYVVARLGYKYYGYELADAGFQKESGIIYKRYVTIPYDRIQNVDINRGLLSRLLGLSEVNIQTAGSSATSSKGEGRLPGLSHEVAQQLRDDVLARAKQARSQGL